MKYPKDPVIERYATVAYLVSVLEALRPHEDNPFIKFSMEALEDLSQKIADGEQTELLKPELLKDVTPAEILSIVQDVLKSVDNRPN